MEIITIILILIVTAIILYKLRPASYPKKLQGQFVGEAKPGETRVLRGFDAEEKLIDYNLEGYETIDDLVNGMKKENKAEYIGWRNLEETKVAKTFTVVQNGKEVEKKIYKYKMSKYQYLSSYEFNSLINRISKGLKEMGLKKGDKISIFAETRYEWMTMLLAATRQGIIVVTVYATLSDESVKIALDENNIKACVVSNDTIARFRRINLSNKETVKIINVDKKNEEIKDDKVIYFDDLKKNEEIKEGEYETVKSTDLSMIMYTSGTSSSPKGVLIEQKQILMLSYGFQKFLMVNRKRFIAFLPLAHIFEISIEFAFLMNFGTIGYANIRTLTSGGCYECQSDLIELNPDAMIGVPTVFNRVRKGVLENVFRQSKFKQIMFNFGMFIKTQCYVNYKLRTPYLFYPLVKLVDKLIFNGIKQTLVGSNLEIVVVGGSALPIELQHFLQCILPNTSIHQGFGMTELSGAACCMPRGDATTSTIGHIFPMYECKLRDVPELGYLTTDNPPRGEILFRGMPVTKGYYNRPEENEASFTEDGWFCTGDVGTITSDLHICIIDRKKNIVKQPCGEYISLEFIESKYLSNRAIENICVFADAFHDFVIALIIPNRQVITEISELPFEEAIKDEGVRKRYRELMKESEGALSERQKVKYFTLVPDEWTAENELLTAALKLKRQSIRHKYFIAVEQMFSMP